MSKKKIRIIFAGTNNFSCQHLISLLSSKYIVKAIITKYSSNNHRKKKSQIKKIALQKSIPIFQPKNLKKKIFYNQIKEIKANILIVCAYGMLIPSKILKLFPKGAFNIHTSLLPRWRGAAPIQWSILSGDKYTGISIIKMNSNIDTGKIVFSISCPISISDTTKTLYKKLIPISLKAINYILTKIIHKKKLKYKIQNEKKATYAPKIQKKDTRILWTNSAEYNERLIRALHPKPHSYFILKNKIIKIIHASVIINKNNEKKYSIGEIIQADKLGIQVYTKKNFLNIENIQIEGGKSMPIYAVLNSKKSWFLPGTLLS